MITELWSQLSPYAGLVALGPLCEFALRTARPAPRSRMWPVRGMIFGLLLALIAWLFKVWFFQSAGQPGAVTVRVPDAMGAYNLVMSIIGFVISALTGLAVAAAWRAVDEANRATETVRRLTLDHEFELRRIAAYAEAVNELLRARVLPDYAAKLQPRAELVELFGLLNPFDIASRANDLVINNTVFSELGPEGVRLLGVLSQHESIPEDLRIAAHEAISMAPKPPRRPVGAAGSGGRRP